MRKSGFIVLACVLLLAVVSVAVPATASAAITSVKWSVPVYQGGDAFHGADVVAFTAGTTANVTVQVTNDQAFDVTIKEARIVLDWGAEHAGTGPAALKPNETGSYSFSVPIPAFASSQVLHSYQVMVGYQLQNASYVKHAKAHEFLGDGNGVALQFYTVSAPVVAATLEVSWLNTLATPNTIIVQDPSSYTLDALNGRITFGAAPPAGTRVFADYQYFEVLGSGTGTQTVYGTVSKPVVNGSLQVYVATPATGEFHAATGWTADYETGKITLASAPTGFQQVFATYESWARWAVFPGTNLAVYGADQAAAMTAFREYEDLAINAPEFWLPLSTAGATARSNAAVLAAQADAQYRAGDFATASTLYRQAVDQLKASYAANDRLSNDAETAIKELVQKTGPVVGGYANKLNGEAESARGQANMYKNVGVFSILLGVATLLAGLGGLVWAYSRLVEARSHRQP